MARSYALALGALLFAACASSAGGTRSTDDPRVRSFRGQVPPDVPADASWLNVPATSLAALRGRVVYVQFAFPT